MSVGRSEGAWPLSSRCYCCHQPSSKLVNPPPPLLPQTLLPLQLTLDLSRSFHSIPSNSSFVHISATLTIVRAPDRIVAELPSFISPSIPLCCLSNTHTHALKSAIHNRYQPLSHSFLRLLIIEFCTTKRGFVLDRSVYLGTGGTYWRERVHARAGAFIISRSLSY